MTLREVFTLVGFKVDDIGLQMYDKAIGQIYDKAANLNSNLNRVADSISGIGQRLTMGLSLPIAGVATASVMASSKLEDLQTSMETMLGDSSKATALIQEMMQVARKTPFSLEDVAKNTTMLIGMGAESQNVLKELTMLSDVASGANTPLERIAYNFSQVRTQGRLTSMDLKDFLRAGIPLLPTLASMYAGGDVKKVREMVTKNLISFDMVKSAFAKMTSEGGRYFNLSEKRSLTTTGRFMNLGDSIFRVRVALGKMIVDTFHLNQVFSKIGDAVENFAIWLDKLAPWQKKFLVWLGATLFVLGPLLVAFAFFLKMFLFFKTAMAVFQFAGIVGNLRLIIPLLWKGAVAMAAMAWQVTLISLALAALYIIADDIIGFFTGKDSLIIPAFQKLFKWWSDGAKDLFDMWLSGIQVIGDFFKNIWATISTFWVEGFHSLVDSFKSLWEGVFDWLSNLGPWKTLEKLGGWIAQTTGAGTPAVAMPGAAWAPSSTAVASNFNPSGGSSYQISIGTIPITVPAGSTKDQTEFLKKTAQLSMEVAIQDSIRKVVAGDIKSSTRH